MKYMNMMLVALLFLFAYVSADIGCLQSIDGVAVPTSPSTVTGKSLSACNADAVFDEVNVADGIPDVSVGGYTLKSVKYGTYLAPKGNSIVLKTTPFTWQRSGDSIGTGEFGNTYFVFQGGVTKYLAVCNDDIFLTQGVGRCEIFEDVTGA